MSSRHDGFCPGFPPAHRAAIPVLALLVAASSLFGCSSDEADTTVIINEVSPRSLSGGDWVELYNRGDEAVDLSGYGLKDSKADRKAWRFADGTILNPGRYIVVRRDEDEAYSPPEFTFGLGGEDRIILVDDEGRTVDEIGWDSALPEGRPLGRYPDGGEVQLLSEGTPGLPNTAPPCPDCDTATVPGPSAKNADMYTEFTIVDYFVKVDDADLKALFEARDKKERIWIPCEFTFGGESFTGADMRLKGAPEDWGGDGYQDQFIIRFNGRIDGGRFRGLRRLNLDAQKADPSRIRNNLGMYVMRRAGLRTPRANHARLHINGALYGLYENIEVIDKEFVEDRFANSDANLFDGPELATNEQTGDRAAFEVMVDTALASCSDPNTYAANLSSHIALEPMLRLLAAEAALASPKNFWADGIESTDGEFGAWNFYLYEDPTEGFVLMPWDLDAILNPGFVSPDADVFTFADAESTTDGSVPWTCLQNHPASRQAFFTYLSIVRNDILATLPDVAGSYCGLIRGELERDPNYSRTLSEFDTACADIQTFIGARSTYLDQVIAAQ